VLLAASGSKNRAPPPSRSAPLSPERDWHPRPPATHSISPTARSRPSSSSCARAETPIRRPLVKPPPAAPAGAEAERGRQMDPKSRSAANKLTRTPGDPASACGPAYWKRRSLTGKNGSTSGHTSPETIHGATAAGTPSQLDDRCRRPSSSETGSLHKEPHKPPMVRANLPYGIAGAWMHSPRSHRRDHQTIPIY
jgi:hypothetical protein